MPTFTIISCALAVVRAGAVPVYADADAHTWNMKVEDIESLITDKTKDNHGSSYLWFDGGHGSASRNRQET